ncbi:hypothetical protein ISF26_22290 [Gloeobacter morelensis MG652769]|uniref:Uncharacterized protein n=2 Tax=Gloeobacter TaxID=33071 RepID=A0ABY3PL94_9CYAN|nr:hypothetical protein ISF26_22290 [Gloeobacter morelensis MG652769]
MQCKPATSFAIGLLLPVVLGALLPVSTLALTWGEVIGIGAGVTAVNTIRANNQTRGGYYPPEAEYGRGVNDGIKHLRYDNPRNSSAYDQGYQEGIRRASRGR